MRCVTTKVIDSHYLATPASPFVLKVKIKGQGHRVKKVGVGKDLYRMP